MKTVPNFGKIKSIAVKNLLTFSLCSRGGWGLSWYDPGLQHARSSILSHQNQGLYNALVPEKTICKRIIPSECKDVLFVAKVYNFMNAKA